MSTWVKMKGSLLGAVALGTWMVVSVAGQTPDSASANTDDKLEAISKKIDEQNRKIDLLSQEILKLEMQLSNVRPGVMIGEGAPNYSPTVTPADAGHSPTGTTHMVARGETLTSIAKMYNVSVIELQKFNHIENDRKLQIGQTLSIPGPGGAAAASPSPTASASPGNH
jgi:LysM repeat protein